LSTFAGRAQDLKPWLVGAAINRDRSLRLQYLAGMGLNLYRGGPIYREILKYRRYPEGLFLLPESSEESLRKILGQPADSGSALPARPPASPPSK